MLHVIDSQINRNLLCAAAAEFPATNWPHWHHYDNGKLATHDESRIPPACRLVLNKMIETIPVPGDCFADFSFYGAGLHCMPLDRRLELTLTPRSTRTGDGLERILPCCF